MTKPNLLKILNSETRNSKNLDAFFGLFLGYSFILVGIIVWLRWVFRITHLEFNQSIYILIVSNITVWAGLYLIFASNRLKNGIQQDLKKQKISVLKKKKE